MLELLLSTTMACEDANAVIFRIKKHEHLKPAYKLELVETIKDYTPECNHYWDANDWRNGETDPPQGEKVNHPLQEKTNEHTYSNQK